MNLDRSTVGYKSNLQVVRKQSAFDDNEFLLSIRDPFALEELQKNIKLKRTNYTLSEIQENIRKAGGMHCAYAYKDDYPWGTIKNENGNEIVVCKCINTNCKRFESCRPDFSKDEILVLKENEISQRKLMLKSEKIESSNIKEKNDKDLEALSEIIYEDINSEEKEEYNGKGGVENIAEENSVKEDLIEIESVEVTETIEDEKTIGFEAFKSIEQSKYINYGANKRVVINAGPGTGKTHTVVEKIINILEEDDDVEGDMLLVLCFSRAAVEVVRNRLEQAWRNGRAGNEIRNVEIRTFDSFATYVISWIAENEEGILPENYCIGSQNYDERIETAIKILEQKKDIFIEYKHIIVDEVQDLVGIRAQLVLKILKNIPSSCGVTLLGDACQSIYDYQIDNSNDNINSETFYKNIFKAYSYADYYSFEKNYRQSDEKFTSMLDNYRKAILLGDFQDRKKALKYIWENIKTEDTINWKHPDKSKLEEYTKGGKTVGILTRTNGQALKISTWMKNENIDHELKRPLNTNYIAEWIGKVFTNYKYDNINEDSFYSVFKEVYPDIDREVVEEYWNSLVMTQKESKSTYSVESLLKGILKNCQDNSFNSKGTTDSLITVSNIHRAKGLEFDTVFILDEIFDNMLESQIDNIIEDKICYVALTRAKQNIMKIKLKPMYISIYKQDSNRCYCKKRNPKTKRIRLSEFEVGIKDDINTSSFAEKGKQSLINNIYEGQQLILKVNRNNESAPEFYSILDDEDEKTVLGKMSKEFIKEIELVSKQIYNLPNKAHLGNGLYPDKIIDLYVDQKVTFISSDADGRPEAKIFGDVCIWNGFTVSGFARMIKERY